MICDKFVACNRTSVCGEINACGDGRQSSNGGVLSVGWWNNGIVMLEVTTIKVKWWCQQPTITLKVKKTQNPISNLCVSPVHANHWIQFPGDQSQCVNQLFTSYICYHGWFPPTHEIFKKIIIESQNKVHI
jgi:hypothetical protein